MNPAAHQRLWPSVHVETNPARRLHRGDALDPQRVVLRFGERASGALLGCGPYGRGLEPGFGPYRIRLGPRRLFERLFGRLTLGFDGGVRRGRRIVASVMAHRCRCVVIR